MDLETLYCFKLTDPSGEFEPGTEFLDALELDYSSYFERESRQVWHTVYAQTLDDAKALHEQLRQLIPQYREWGVEFTQGEIFELHKAEWAEAWKKYFTPVEISDTLLVTPAWQQPEPKPGQAVLRIDTGMSFGTGQHPTTFYCLKKIDEFAATGMSSLLDAGCGSGILAIAGALRGYSKIDAFDFDPEAVRMTVENLQLNNIPPNAVKCETADAADYPGDPAGYDLVCANILGHLLITFRFNIASWVKPDGKLVLAGILTRDFDRVSESFVEIGFTEVERETIKEWTGGTFVKR
jgi:ribosomal protein L11 methyltransferase